MPFRHRAAPARRSQQTTSCLPWESFCACMTGQASSIRLTRAWLQHFPGSGPDLMLHTCTWLAALPIPSPQLPRMTKLLTCFIYMYMQNHRLLWRSPGDGCTEVRKEITCSCISKGRKGNTLPPQPARRAKDKCQPEGAGRALSPRVLEPSTSQQQQGR
jgi:hypothetical protein